MFAPEGFVSIFEIGDLVRSSILQNSANLDGEYDIGGKKAIAINLVLARAKSGLHVCSLEGDLFRVPRKLAAFSSSEDEIGNAMQGFWYINHGTGLVCVSRAKTRATRLEERKSNLRAEFRVARRPENQKTGKFAEKARRRLIRINEQTSSFVGFLQNIEAFDGFSPCLKEDGLENLIEQAVSDVLSATYSEQEIETTIGRPAKTEIVRQAFDAVFPNGKGNATWKQVCVLIEAECGVGTSVDTVKRALGLRSD